MWPSFIELTERRNLFVHTDGVVSSQYMAVCKSHACKLDSEVCEGHRLDVPQDYFEASHDCIFEMGVKLAHVLWRKLFPDERKIEDGNFTSITYDLIDSGKFDLAARLLDFACSDFKKFSDEVHELTLIVNRAQAYKWRGDDEGCNNIMRAVDWSAKGDHFRLADAVLAEDWEVAGLIMKRVGRDGPVSKTDYRDWPLFKNFRKQDIFSNAYQSVFSESFNDGSELKNTDPTPERSDIPVPNP